MNVGKITHTFLFSNVCVDIILLWVALIVIKRGDDFRAGISFVIGLNQTRT